MGLNGPEQPHLGPSPQMPTGRASIAGTQPALCCCPTASSGLWGPASLCTRPQQGCPSEVCAWLCQAQLPPGPGWPHPPQLHKAKAQFGGQQVSPCQSLLRCGGTRKQMVGGFTPSSTELQAVQRYVLYIVFLKYGAVRRLLKS